MALFDFITDAAPNGYFLRDLIVFGDLRAGSSVAKGFIFEPPDLANAGVDGMAEMGA